MAPQKFARFSELPLELRRRIWNLSHAPRIIRAKWENVLTEAEHIMIYRLYAGPVPRLLHVCRDSRQEGLRRYTAVATRVRFSNNSSKLPFENNRIHKIYIDTERDTIYVINFPSTDQLLRWWRRLNTPSIGGAGGLKPGKGPIAAVEIVTGGGRGDEARESTSVKTITAGSSAEDRTELKGKERLGRASHEKDKENTTDIKDVPLSDRRMIQRIAFHAKIFDRLEGTLKRLDIFHSLIMQNPSLSISIILDNIGDSFEYATKDIQQFHFKVPKPLPNAVGRGKGNAGGRWGKRAVREKILGVGGILWTHPRVAVGLAAHPEGRKEQVRAMAAWEKWVTENPGWEGPELAMWSIEKLKIKVF